MYSILPVSSAVTTTSSMYRICNFSCNSTEVTSRNQKLSTFSAYDIGLDRTTARLRPNRPAADMGRDGGEIFGELLENFGGIFDNFWILFVPCPRQSGQSGQSEYSGQSGHKPYI